MQSYSIGIDIGGTKIKFMTMNDSLDVFYEKTIPTEASVGYQNIMNNIINEVKDIFQHHGQQECIGIGIGAPGPVDVIGGFVESPPNLPGWDHVAIVQDLKDTLGVPCYLENDANLAALGEYQFGLDGVPKTMLYITVSTGIGAGIIHNGQIFQGAFGNAGELGHMIIVPDGNLCNCGKKGCLEAYSSGTAISKMALDQLGLNLSAKEVALRAEEGDRVSEKILREAFDYLGFAISNSLYCFDPDYVVIGGGLSLLGNKLLTPIKAKVKKYTLINTNKVTISTAIKGHSVGAIGAAFYPYAIKQSYS